MPTVRRWRTSKPETICTDCRNETTPPSMQETSSQWNYKPQSSPRVRPEQTRHHRRDFSTDRPRGSRTERRPRSLWAVAQFCDDQAPHRVARRCQETQEEYRRPLCRCLVRRRSYSSSRWTSQGTCRWQVDGKSFSWSRCHMSTAGIRTASERAATATSAAVVKPRPTDCTTWRPVALWTVKDIHKFWQYLRLSILSQMKSSICALMTALNRCGRSTKTFETNWKQKRLSHRMFVIEQRRNSLWKTPLETLLTNLLSSLNDFSSTRMMKIPTPNDDCRGVNENSGDAQLNLESEMVGEFENSTIDTIQNNDCSSFPSSDNESVAIVATYLAVDNFDLFRVCPAKKRRNQATERQLPKTSHQTSVSGSCWGRRTSQSALNLPNDTSLLLSDPRVTRSETNNQCTMSLIWMCETVEHKSARTRS